MTELLKPRVVSVLDEPGKLSLHRLRVDFEGPVRRKQYAALRTRLLGFPAVTRVDSNDYVSPRYATVEINPSTPDEQALRLHAAIIDLLQPRLRSCIAEVRVATEHGLRKSAQLALFEVVCMVPHADRFVIGPAIERVLAPLGDKVGYLPNVQEGAQNTYHIAVQPYQAPDNLELFLADGLETVGLDLGTWRQVEISVAEYLAALTPKSKLN